MSEYPSPRPTADVTFSTDGGSPRTEPSSGLRAAGYAYRSTVAHDNLNWLLNALGESLDWLRAAILRAWSQPYEAWAAHAWGEPFMLRLDPSALIGDWVESKGLGGSGGTNDSQICSDGARVFYVRGASIYMARNDHATDAAVIASAAFNDVGQPVAMHTDGRLVAVGSTGGSGGDDVQAYLIGDDGTLTLWFASAGEDGCYAVHCDWGAGGLTDGVLWWGTEAGELYSHSVGESSVIVTGTIAAAIRALDTCGPLLFVATSDGELRSFYKANSLPNVGNDITDNPHLSYIDLSYGTARTISLCNDGERVYMLVDGAGTGTTDIESIQLHAFDIWSGTLLFSKYTNINVSAARRIRVECDDRYVYATWARAGGELIVRVFHKTTGATIYDRRPGANFFFTVDGVNTLYVLNSNADTLSQTRLGRGPGLFVRQAPMQGLTYRRVLAALTRHP